MQHHYATKAIETALRMVVNCGPEFFRQPKNEFRFAHPDRIAVACATVRDAVKPEDGDTYSTCLFLGSVGPAFVFFLRLVVVEPNTVVVYLIGSKVRHTLHPRHEAWNGTALEALACEFSEWARQSIRQHLTGKTAVFVNRYHPRDEPGQSCGPICAC